MEKLELVEPSVRYRDGFIRNVHDFLGNDETHYVEKYREALVDFAVFVRQLRDHARGVDSPYGSIACSTFWLVNGDNEVLGVIRIRHEAMPVHGHIGYDVPSRYRRKGYGTKMLGLAFPKIRQMGLSSVIVTCEEDNLWSEKVIKSNGGFLIDRVIDNKDGKVYKQHLIYL